MRCIVLSARVVATARPKRESRTQKDRSVRRTPASGLLNCDRRENSSFSSVDTSRPNRRSAKHRVGCCVAIFAWRRSGRAVLNAIGDFAPFLARQIRRCVVQPLPNSQEARFEPWLKAKATAERQSDHRLVGPQRIAEEEFDAVGRRFAFDCLEHLRSDAKSRQSSAIDMANSPARYAQKRPPGPRQRPFQGPLPSRLGAGSACHDHWRPRRTPIPTPEVRLRRPETDCNAIAEKTLGHNFARRRRRWSGPDEEPTTPFCHGVLN